MSKKPRSIEVNTKIMLEGIERSANQDEEESDHKVVHAEGVVRTSRSKSRSLSNKVVEVGSVAGGILGAMERMSKGCQGFRETVWWCSRCGRKVSTQSLLNTISANNVCS